MKEGTSRRDFLDTDTNANGTQMLYPDTQNNHKSMEHSEKGAMHDLLRWLDDVDVDDKVKYSFIRYINGLKPSSINSSCAFPNVSLDDKDIQRKRVGLLNDGDSIHFGQRNAVTPLLERRRMKDLVTSAVDGDINGKFRHHFSTNNVKDTVIKTPSTSSESDTSSPEHKYVDHQHDVKTVYMSRRRKAVANKSGRSTKMKKIMNKTSKTDKKTRNKLSKRRPIITSRSAQIKWNSLSDAESDEFANYE